MSTGTAHGLVRAMDWELGGIETEGDSVKVEFLLPYPEGGLPGWPHQVDLTLTLRLDEQLHISLTSHNRGAETVSISQALHSYFAVSDVRNVHVEGVDGLSYIETLDDWKTTASNGDLHFAGETDRIYLDAPPQLSIVDPAWERRIVADQQRLAHGSDLEPVDRPCGRIQRHGRRWLAAHAVHRDGECDG